MRLPKQISICGHTIKVEERKGLVVNGEEVWGVYDDDKQTIYLKSGMEKTRKMEILLHECIHAIDHIYVLRLPEKAVKILGVEVLALIRNNRLNFLERRNETK